MTTQTTGPGSRALRPRRSNLAVPGSSVKMLSKAKGLGADQAFQLLAQASMTGNRKLRDVAEHLVTTGELLAPPARGTVREPGRGGRRPRPTPGVRHHP